MIHYLMASLHFFTTLIRLFQVICLSFMCSFGEWSGFKVPFFSHNQFILANYLLISQYIYIFTCSAGIFFCINHVMLCRNIIYVWLFFFIGAVLLWPITTIEEDLGLSLLSCWTNWTDYCCSRSLSLMIIYSGYRTGQ